MTWALVAVGGALGAAGRFVVDGAVSRWTGGGWPWGTLVVNVLGSGALGVVVGLRLGEGPAALLGAGLCGAFTTASAFSWDAAALFSRRGRVAAVGYVLLTTVLSVGALATGRAIAGA